MNDDRLTGLLGALRNERMDRLADERLRARLENAWTTRRQQQSFGFRLRRLAPVLGTLILFAGLGAATMSASGDSALYGIRVAVEDAAVALHQQPEDRAQYLLSLLDQRQFEAARLESTGNALAASRVRQIEQDTLRTVQATLPRAPEVELPLATPSPSATPTASPTPEPTPSPTPSPSPTPIATVRPSTPPRTATPAPTPVRTDTATPRPTATPVPTPSPTAIAVTAIGIVKNADGTPANGVCVRLATANTTCLFTTGTDGAYHVTMSAKVGQSILLIFTRQEGTILWKATATMVVKGTTVQIPTVTLQK